MYIPSCESKWMHFHGNVISNQRPSSFSLVFGYSQSHLLSNIFKYFDEDETQKCTWIEDFVLKMAKLIANMLEVWGWPLQWNDFSQTCLLWFVNIHDKKRNCNTHKKTCVCQQFLFQNLNLTWEDIDSNDKLRLDVSNAY